MRVLEDFGCEDREDYLNANILHRKNQNLSLLYKDLSATPFEGPNEKFRRCVPNEL